MPTKKLYQNPRKLKVPGLVLNGNVFEKKTKRKNTAKNVNTYLMYYLNTSTIHGVKYIGETGRYLIEKLLWFCIIVTLCSLCIFLITKTYVKWKTSPVIVSFETKETPIFEIPFPAVTVCPEVKIAPEYFNLTSYVIRRSQNLNVTEKENKLFEAMMLVCNKFSALADKFFGFEVNKSFMDHTILKETLQYVPLPIFNNVTTFRFLGKNVREGKSISITEEGFCLSFNMLPINDIVYFVEDFIRNQSSPEIKVKKWSLEEGYPEGDDLDSYPRRTFLSGFDGGLEADALYINRSQMDYLCEEGVQGFKVVLHHPCELPNMDKHFRVPLNQAVLVAIKPTMIKVSKELINYKPVDRQCYFGEEKSLAFYRIYTQQNCLVECFTNYTLEHCGCVPFWLQYRNDVKICGPGKTTCIKESKVAYLRQKENSKLGQCECLPLCTSLSYDIETSYTDWKWRDFLKIYNVRGLSFLNFDAEMYVARIVVLMLLLVCRRAHFSKLVVYFKDLQFLTSKRHELYGIHDFFSNVGGLLGLFIGFSLVSVVEIVYILTLRIVCNIKKYGREYWSGEPQFMGRQS